MSVKEQIKEYLVSEGLRPQEENFGFYFRYQMLNFYIHWSEDDEFYLSISLPNIFEADENNRVDVLETLNKLAMGRKVVKGCLVENAVWVTAEQLLDTDPNFGDIIPRTLGMLMQARDYFYDTLKQM